MVVLDDELLTAAQAAELLKVPPRWLQRQQNMPFKVRLSPRKIRHSKQKLLKWLAIRPS
jgi:hypothetical protein